MCYYRDRNEIPVFQCICLTKDGKGPRCRNSVKRFHERCHVHNKSGMVCRQSPDHRFDYMRSQAPRIYEDLQTAQGTLPERKQPTGFGTFADITPRQD